MTAHNLSWLDVYENIHTLARFLADEKSYSMDNILYFLEKPYKYTDEYNEMITWRENYCEACECSPCQAPPEVIQKVVTTFPYHKVKSK